MKEFERKRLLERVEREGATVGARIPDTIDLQGESFDLRSFVFETKRLETVPADHEERVEAAKRRLRKERQERRHDLETATLTAEEGERLAETIVGIDRALNALESLGTTDLEAEERASQTADQKRWLTFLKKALGRADDERGHGVRQR
ncbi:MAG: DUF5788 family protein [Halanaeroarchaeum sp.]